MQRIANLPDGKTTHRKLYPIPWLDGCEGGLVSFFGYLVPKPLSILKSKTRKRLLQMKGAPGEREGKRNMENSHPVHRRNNKTCNCPLQTELSGFFWGLCWLFQVFLCGFLAGWFGVFCCSWPGLDFWFFFSPKINEFELERSFNHWNQSYGAVKGAANQEQKIFPHRFASSSWGCFSSGLCISPCIWTSSNYQED